MISMLALSRMNAAVANSVDADLRQRGCMLYRSPSSREITEGVLFITFINVD